MVVSPTVPIRCDIVTSRPIKLWAKKWKDSFVNKLYQFTFLYRRIAIKLLLVNLPAHAPLPSPDNNNTKISKKIKLRLKITKVS